MPVERRKRKGKREGRTKRKRLRAIAQKSAVALFCLSLAHIFARFRLDADSIDAHRAAFAAKSTRRTDTPLAASRLLRVAAPGLRGKAP